MTISEEKMYIAVIISFVIMMLFERKCENITILDTRCNKMQVTVKRDGCSAAKIK